MTVVVDTNVILVANDAHEDASPECVLECVGRLEKLMKTGSVAIDDAHRILSEYQNKTSPTRAKGVGDLFVRWVLKNLANSTRVHQVSLFESAEGRFSDFPDVALEASFDPSDRKFVAVASAHPDKPEIWQASDCKWLDWWQALRACGVEVQFLCSGDVCRFYQRKFPGKPLPNLP